MRPFSLSHFYGSAIASVTLLAFSSPCPVKAQSLLANGSFESGSFSNWNLSTQSGSAGGFQLSSAMTTPGEEYPTPGPADGSFYAVTDSFAPLTDGPGAYSLTASFAVPANAGKVTLSFQMFVNDWNGAGALNSGGALDYSVAAPTQFARVDLLTATASPFTVASPDVIRNFYLGVDGPVVPYPYTSFQFDISNDAQAGGIYQLRFASVQNQFSLNLGVDAVEVIAIPATAAAPEPETLPLTLTGAAIFLCAAPLRRRRFTTLSETEKGTR